jgi:uncharacterized protein YodC (DUF2158 family)
MIIPPVEFEFKEGQKVRRVEGGPVMVVDSAHSRLVTCLVLTQAGLEKKVFPAAALKTVDELTAPEAIRSSDADQEHSPPGDQDS